MINGSYKAGLAITLQKQTTDSLFLYGMLNSVPKVVTAYEEVTKQYKEIRPTVPFNTINFDISNEKLDILITSIKAALRAAMEQQSEELNRTEKRQNVLDSLQLAKEYLTALNNIVNEVKTK
jgi:hypothetical protein